MNKNGKKWLKNRVFGYLKKMMSLVLPVRIVLEKIWFSANEISVFLNHQYFINRLMFDFDFWYKNRHERKEQGLLASSLKKKN